jgi:acetyl esterase/lipase
MPVVHHSDARSAFHFSRAIAQASGMGSSAPDVRRVAGLRLRHARVRVMWPDGDRPALLVLVPGASDELAAHLCARAGLLVLAPAWGGAPLRDATATLDWAAQHGAELGADAGRLAVAGAGAGAALAATLALRAGDRGWPRLARQVLIDPASHGVSAISGMPAIDPSGATPDGAPNGSAARMAGVAPATVVGGRDCAARLRWAGVEVEELDACADLAPALRRVFGGGAA